MKISNPLEKEVYYIRIAIITAVISLLSAKLGLYNSYFEIPNGELDATTLNVIIILLIYTSSIFTFFSLNSQINLLIIYLGYSITRLTYELFFTFGMGGGNFYYYTAKGDELITSFNLSDVFLPFLDYGLIIFLALSLILKLIINYILK